MQSNQPKTPRCSKRILMPIPIRMMPPAISALDLYLEPNTFPIFTPIAERVKVMMPIKLTAGTMRTLKNAKVIPKIGRAHV